MKKHSLIKIILDLNNHFICLGDASSLFRVVSEQVFDIQNYHDKVRQDCATFMELNIKDYANEVDKNFYNYVSNLRRNRTYGTLLELRVIARMYK